MLHAYQKRCLAFVPYVTTASFDQSRVDAAVDAALVCEAAGLDPSGAHGASFGGAAAPQRDCSDAAPLLEAEGEAVNPAVLQQIAIGVRRGQCGANSAWLATIASRAMADDYERPQCAGKHPPTAAGVTCL